MFVLKLKISRETNSKCENVIYCEQVEVGARIFMFRIDSGGGCGCGGDDDDDDVGGDDGGDDDVGDEDDDDVGGDDDDDGDDDNVGGDDDDDSDGDDDYFDGEDDDDLIILKWGWGFWFDHETGRNCQCKTQKWKLVENKWNKIFILKNDWK